MEIGFHEGVELEEGRRACHGVTHGWCSLKKLFVMSGVFPASQTTAGQIRELQGKESGIRFANPCPAWRMSVAITQF